MLSRSTRNVSVKKSKINRDTTRAVNMEDTTPTESVTAKP